MELIPEQQIHPNKIRQVFILAVIILIGWMLYKEMAFMLGAFLGAVALYMLLRVLMFKLVFTYKWKRWLAALTLILITLLVIVLPTTLIINVLIDKLTPVLEDTDRINQSIQKLDKYVHDKFKFDILTKGNLEKIQVTLTKWGSSALGSTLNLVTNLVVMYFILWFMLVSGGEMERSLRRNLPFKKLNTSKLLQEIRSMVVSNAIGIPVLGAIQGLMAIIGYYIFDVNEPVLWGILTGIASVVPFVGTMIIWVPIVILKMASGDLTNGYWLIFWGLIVIGSSDNVFRFILQKYVADVHPLITVFGVIVGLNMFGFLGLIFGPMLISVLLLLVRIYHDEFTTDSEIIETEEKIIENSA